MSLKLLFARHGASDAHDIDEDTVDIFRQTRTTPLGQRGRNQARHLGKKISIFRPDVLICSPYVRARETAEIIAEYAPLFPNTLDDLREIRRIVDGQSIYSQINLDYKKWRGETIRTGNLNDRFHPNDESFEELFVRATKIKYWLLQEFDGQTVLVVSHSQFLAMLITSMLHGDRPEPSVLFGSFNRHFMNHGALSIIKHNSLRWNLESFNDTSHLQ